MRQSGLRREDWRAIVEKIHRRVAGTSFIDRRKNNANKCGLNHNPTVYTIPTQNPDMARKKNQVTKKFLRKGAGIGRTGYPLVAWDQVCKDKKEEGLGIKRLDWMNTALLMK